MDYIFYKFMQDPRVTMRWIMDFGQVDYLLQLCTLRRWITFYRFNQIDYISGIVCVLINERKSTAF